MVEGSSRVTVRVNGADHEWDVDTTATLVDLLRERLSLTGCRQTCGIGVCGSCAVLLNGRAVNACLTPGFLLDGATVVTVEGLHAQGLHPVQRAFIAEQAFQCSFCTPGFVISMVGALDERARAHDGDTAESDASAAAASGPEEALAGQLCRCGSYQEVMAAARRLWGQPAAAESGQVASQGEGAGHVRWAGHGRSARREGGAAT